MKSSEIKEQLDLAKDKERDAERKFNEAKSSAEAVISRADQIVHENETALASATGHKESAGNKVGQLKHAFEAASRGLEKKIREINSKRATIVCCDNALNNYWSRKCHVEAEIGSLRSQSFACHDEKQKANIEALIASREALVGFYDKQITAYDKLKAKTQAEMPRIEHEVVAYRDMISKVKPQLESAEEALKAAIEQETVAKEALSKSREMRDKDIETSNQRLREASEAHENAKKYVAYWESYLNAALTQLNNYAYGRD